MTPLWSTTITPFVRWLTGDIVRLRPQVRSDDPYSVFPVLEHALRTEGSSRSVGSTSTTVISRTSCSRGRRWRTSRERSRPTEGLGSTHLVDRAPELREGRRGDGGVGAGFQSHVRADAPSACAPHRHSRQGVRGERQGAAVRRSAQRVMTASACPVCRADHNRKSAAARVSARGLPSARRR